MDIACGTGNYTVSLENTRLQMTGSDISKEMIKKAKGKSNTINWEVSDVNRLPYEDKTFDGVTCTLAIHHLNDLLKPFNKVFRVLNKGKFVIFTSSPEQMNNYWLKEYFPAAIEASANQMPALAEVSKTLKSSGQTKQ